MVTSAAYLLTKPSPQKGDDPVSYTHLGRVVYGVVNALIFRAGSYSFQIFFTAAFVTALPGIILQLLVIPPILVLLQKARVLEPQPTAA